MTDEKDFADGGREHATTDPPHAHRASDQRRWKDLLKHRWPTALGIAALTAFDLQVNVGFVSFLSALIVVMALVYLGAAVLDRSRSAWVVFLDAFAVVLCEVEGPERRRMMDLQV